LVKRDDQGKLAGLFVAYTYTSTMFGGYRKWFACPGCRRPARILYGVHSLRCRRCRGLKYASQSEAPPLAGATQSCLVYGAGWARAVPPLMGRSRPSLALDDLRTPIRRYRRNGSSARLEASDDSTVRKAVFGLLSPQKTRVRARGSAVFLG